jgi:hypothetical protein
MLNHLFAISLVLDDALVEVCKMGLWVEFGFHYSSGVVKVKVGA